MEIFSGYKTYDFMGKRNVFIGISVAFLLVSFALLFSKGLNYGIDFAGGTVVQVKYEEPAPIADIRKAISEDSMFENATITKFGSDYEVVIKFKTSSQNVDKDVGDSIRSLLIDTGKLEIRRVDMVGPKVGGELREQGLLSLFFSIIAILVYISFRFEWRFAVASIFALIHDISIAIGAIVLFQVEVNLDILAALLTILGYSLNDTIIVFDRIREGIKDAKTFDLTSVINFSVSRTLSRTTLTSLTTFFVVLTLYLFGGEIISGFSFTLLVGVVVGTYSSIFIASAALVWFKFSIENFKKKEAEKAKIQLEKDKIRAQYEQGTV